MRDTSAVYQPQARTQFVMLPNTLPLGGILPELRLLPSGTFAVVIGETSFGVSATAAAARAAPTPYRPHPGERMGARGVLSLTDGSVLLVGGRRSAAFGSAVARDVWRYDLATGEWARVFRNARPEPMHLLALTYDYNGKKLLLLDEFPFVGAGTLRLIEYDGIRESGRVASTWARSGHYSSFTLTALDDGSALLSGAGANQTDVYRLRVTDGELHFTGFARLHGTLLDAPLYTSRGVYFPLALRGQQELVALNDGDFRAARDEPKHLLGIGNGSGLVQKPPPPPPRR